MRSGPNELHSAPFREGSLPLPYCSVQIGHYRVVRELARGGMGVVYVARHEQLARDVALKVMKVGAGKVDASLLKRFEAEAQTVAQLDHPNVVRVHEVGTEGRNPFLVMDLIDGQSLHDLLKEQGPLEPRRAARLTRTLADALEHAHQRSIVHRDLKPANVLINREGEPMVTDFGLAKDLSASGEGLTRDGQWVGTPGFMPPEQATGQLRRIDRRSDVYGLGGTLYAMLTGNPPFAAQTALETVKAIQESRPVPPRQSRPEVEPDLEAICLKCLAKEPEARYQSAQELAADLERFLEGLPVEARAAGAGERLGKWLRRNRTLALSASLGLAVVAALGLGLVAVFVLPERRARSAIAALEAHSEEALEPYALGLVPGASDPDSARLKELLGEALGRAEGTRLQPRARERAALAQATLRWLEQRDADAPVPRGRAGRSVPDLVVDGRLLLRREQLSEAEKVLRALQQRSPRDRLVRLLELQVLAASDPLRLLQQAHTLRDEELRRSCQALLPAALEALFYAEFLAVIAGDGRSSVEARRLEDALAAAGELGLSADELAAAKRAALEASAPRWEERFGLALQRGDEKTLLEGLSRLLVVPPRTWAGPRFRAVAERSVERLAEPLSDVSIPRQRAQVERLISFDHRLVYSVDGRRHAPSRLTRVAWRMPPTRDEREILFRFRYGSAWALPRRVHAGHGALRLSRAALEWLGRQEEAEFSRLARLAAWNDRFDTLDELGDFEPHLRAFVPEVLGAPIHDVAPRYLVQVLAGAMRAVGREVAILSAAERQPLALALRELLQRTRQVLREDPVRDTGSLASCMQLEAGAAGLQQDDDARQARLAELEAELREQIAAKPDARYERHLLAVFLFRIAQSDPFSGREGCLRALALWQEALPNGEEIEALGQYLRCGIFLAQSLRTLDRAEEAWSALQAPRMHLRDSFRHFTGIPPMALDRMIPLVEFTGELARVAWATGRSQEARAILESTLELAPSARIRRQVHDLLAELERQPPGQSLPDVTPPSDPDEAPPEDEESPEPAEDAPEPLPGND